MIANVYIGNIATAGGTADVITASYVPAPTVLADKMLLYFRAIAANATTTPTFSPNGLTAHTIVKQGGAALSAGDIPAAGAVMEVCYNEGLTQWELLNPAASGGGGNGWTVSGTDVVLDTITDNVGIGTATPTSKLHAIASNGTSSSLQVNTAFLQLLSDLLIDIQSSATIQGLAPAINFTADSTKIYVNTGGNVQLGELVGIGNNTKIIIDEGATLITINSNQVLMPLASYADDSAAGGGGLTTGMLYQTSGGGAAPLNAAGIVMIKQ